MPSACTTAPPYRAPSRPHHRSSGFQNNHVEFVPKGLGTLLQWCWHAWRDDLLRPPQTPVPAVAPDRASPLSFGGPVRAQPPGLALVGLDRRDSHRVASPTGPAEALQIHRDLQARRSVGVHWGTFPLTDDTFFVLAVGQTRRLPRRGAP